MTSESSADQLGQLMDEFLERQRRGEYPSLTEFVERHPELEQDIRELFPAVAVMAQAERSEGSPSRAGERNTESPELSRLGDFRIVREIGRGGMGVVYEAVQESLGRRVALKVLPWNALRNEKHLKRFRREARIAAALHHSHIVPVFGIGSTDDTHYFAMQYINGQGLDDVLVELRQLRNHRSREETEGTAGDSTGKTRDASEKAAENSAESRAAALLAHSGSRGSGSGGSSVSTAAVQTRESGQTITHQYFRRVAEIGEVVADALAYAHGHGVLHRDIKPSNIMMEAGGTIWITDYGLAKNTNETWSSTGESGNDDPVEDLTESGDLVGTLRYMAPEQFRGVADERSDIYGLGLTLYELLTLQPAFSAANRAALIREVTQSQPRAPRAIDASIPRDLETIVLKATAPEPELRYQSAGDLQTDLQRFRNNQPIVARRATLLKRFTLWRRRHPGVAALSVLAATLLVLVAAGATASAIMLNARSEALSQTAVRAGRAEQRERRAREESDANLFQAFRAQADASIHSDTSGRRFDSLRAVQAASQMRDRVSVTAETDAALRNQAIAALGLFDVQPRGAPISDSGEKSAWQRWAYDSQLTRCFRINKSGNIDVVSLRDGTEQKSLTGSWSRFEPPYLRCSSNDQLLLICGQLRSGDRCLQVVRISDDATVLGPIPVNSAPHSRAAAFHPAGTHVAFSVDEGIRIAELSSTKTVQTIEQSSAVSFLEFCPNGCHLAAAAGDTLRIFEWASGSKACELRHPDTVPHAGFSSDGRSITTACYDHRVRIWDLEDSGRPPRILVGHSSKVTSAAFSPDDRIVASSGWDNTTRFWNACTGAPVMTVQDTMAGFSAAGDSLVFESVGRRLQTADVAPSDACRVFGQAGRGTTLAIYGVTFSPAGDLLAYTSRDSVVLREWPSGQLRHVIQLGTTALQVSFSPDGSAMFAAGYGVLAAWTADQLKEEAHPTIETASDIRSIDTGVMPRLSLDRNGHNGLLNYATGTNEQLVFSQGKLHRHAVRELQDAGFWFSQLSPSGRYVVHSGKHAHRITVCRTSRNGGGEEETVFERKSASGAFADFDPTEQTLTISADAKLVFIDTRSWKQISEFELHTPGYGRFAYSGDGRLMAVHDGEVIRLLRAEDTAELAVLRNPYRESCASAGPEATLGLAFSRDGRYLASGTGSRDALLYVWDLAVVHSRLGQMNLAWDHPDLQAPSAVHTTLPTPEHCAVSDRPSDSSLEGRLTTINLALARAPRNARLLGRRADILEDLGRYAEAVADYDIIIAELMPETYWYRRRRAWALTECGDYVRASEDHEWLLARNDLAADNRSAALNSLACILLSGPQPLRNPQRAAELAREAVELQPDDPWARSTLGLALCRTGQFEQVVGILDQNMALADCPTHTSDRLCLVWAFTQIGRFDDADSLWREVIRTFEPPTSNANLTEMQELLTEVAAVRSARENN